MDYEVVEARYVRDYVLRLRFRDGTPGEIDLQIDRVWIGLVQRAADPSLFYSTLPRYLSSQATTSSTI